MSPESNEEEMRPEYNIRGGVRGKHFDAYLAMRKQTESSVTIASNYFMTSTDGGNALGNDVGIFREAVVPIVISPQIQFGVPAEVPAR